MTEENTEKKETAPAGGECARERFDPRPYLMQLKGKAYLPVAARLHWIRTEYPEAVMTSELVHMDLGNGIAVFKSEVSIPGRGSAVGYGSETAKDFGDFIEKGQTKSLGRALAALGFGTQFCSDFDEGEEKSGEKNVVDAPVARRPEPAAPAQAPAPPREKPAGASAAPQVLPQQWVNGLQKLAEAAGWDHAKLLAHVRETYQADSLPKLGMVNGRKLRTELEAIVKGEKGDKPVNGAAGPVNVAAAIEEEVM